MTIKQIAYFIELVKQANFTRAAKELFICQSALSKSIKQLEDELGIQLIDRSVYRFKLTPEGEMFYHRGQQVLHNINDELNRLKDSIHLIQGQVVVGIPPVLGTAFFSNVIQDYRKLYPDVDLKIVEVGAKTIKDMVVSGEVDVGVVILPFSDPGFQVFPVIDSENVLLVSKNHPFAERESVKVSELKNEKFIMLNNTFTIHDRILEMCRNVGYEPSVAFVSSQWDFIADLVSKNLGVSMLPRKIFSRFPIPDIRLIRLVEPEFPWRIAMVIKKGKYYSEPIKLFVELTKELNRES